MEPNISPHHLKSVEVTRLFGRYSYTIPQRSAELADINIIYGQNGVGKTTLFKLIFHLLSPADNRGHATAISEIPFESLVVTLNDGTTISAKKDPQLLVGPVEFLITSPGSTEPNSEAWQFIPGASSARTFRPQDLPNNVDLEKIPERMRRDVADALQQRKHFEALGKLSVVTYMLTADRMLQGDSVEEFTGGDARQEGFRRKLTEVVMQYRVNSINHALNNAAAWVQQKVIGSSYSGGQSNGFLYHDVIKRIAKTTYRTRAGLSKSREDKTVASLTTQVLDIEKRSKELSDFGFLRLASLQRCSLSSHRARETG